jgi:hypothetical protein
MRAAVSRHPLLHVAAVTAGLASSSAHAAEWTLAPSGTLSTRVQQNPYLSSDEEQEKERSTGLGVQAALDVLRRTERLSVAIKPVLATYRFPDNSGLDRNELNLQTSLNWKGERVSWLANAGATRDTTLTSELGNTGLTQGNFRHESYVASFGPAWQVSERMQARSTIGSQSHRYDGRESSGLENYLYSRASASVSYVLSDRTSLSFAGAVGRISREGTGANSDNASASVQVRHAWSSRLSFGAEVGPSWVRAGQGRTQGLLYGGDAGLAFEKSSLSLNISRSQDPSGRAVLTEVEQANLAFTTQFTERLSGGVTAGFTRRRSALRELDFEYQRVRYSRIEMRLSWRASPNWLLGASLGNTVQRVGEVFFDEATGRGYDALLTLRWTGDPYVD